jgi:diadenosine tetraphosphate (Ap4A) HIT family hydrolase
MKKRKNSANQKREIEDIRGIKKQIGCLGCAIQGGEVKSSGGSIASTKYFDAHQDYEIPIPGFVILVSKRHLQSVDEFTKEERLDFIEFLCRLRKTMRQAFDIKIVYLIQEEDTSHHFHVWLFPRYDWMAEKFGRKIQSVRTIMEYSRENMKTTKNLKKVDEATKKMRSYFQKEFK